MPNRVEILWDDGERVFSRQFAPETGHSVLLVRPATAQPLPACLDRMAHEFGLKAELDAGWAVRPLTLVRDGGRSLLMMEDPGGVPLKSLLGAPLETARFLELAIGIAGALGQLHLRGLVHKDVKPAHILVRCTDGATRLTGFGLASRLPRERQTPEPPETIAGSLAFMAPEQTGRMNRSIDSRSDLYALGVTFYQMLTGVLPFRASDAMEWVHCHIARQPVPPAGRVASIPEVISRMVMKLLAKTAEERYQSAAGVEHDLRQCLADWQRQGRIDDFALDEHGTPQRLMIPEKLYGREREVDALIATFERVREAGVPELVLVSGYSGIGKSSVVNELHKVLVPPRGLFAAGKFDQYKRHVPYATLVQAFQALVRTLLGKPDAELAGWRQALLDALQRNAGLVTALIPELKLIIGEPPPVPELVAQQAQQRFLDVFRRFIGVFATRAHPLALVLDDLQWADAATLDLLDALLAHPEPRHLIVIGACRDNEIGADHPWALRLQAMREASIRVTELRLAPLASRHIEQLIAEALRAPVAQVAPLARLVRDKTEGNPFFVIQFLHALVNESLLAFDHDARRWRWDTGRIHAKGYTDNVVDLMVGKIARLPPETLHVVQQLACLGNIADLATLCMVLGMSDAQVHAAMWEAVRQELVARHDGAYAFMHDRIHEAAYSLTPEASRADAHLRIGRLLAALTPAPRRDETIFEIVAQLNRGAGLIADPDERERLAELNLQAGQRARASTAYASALTYLTIGTDMLRGDGWQRRPDLMFALESGRAECEFLTGQLQAAEARFAMLAGHARGTAERARITCWQADVYVMLDEHGRAIDVGLAFLRLIGIDWPRQPDATTLREEYDRIWMQLGDRPIASLIDLPPMLDTRALAAIETLTTLFSAALHTDGMLAELTICKAVNLSLRYGNGDASCVAYANLPRIAGRRFGDYQTGFQFGELGCELVRRRGAARFEARTYLSYSLFVARWSQPVRRSNAPLHNAFDAANRTGDVARGAFACNTLVSNQFFDGQPLLELHGEARRALDYARQVGFTLVIDFLEHQLALIRMLCGMTPQFGHLDDPQFSEHDTEAWLTDRSPVRTCWYWIRKLQARYFAGEHADAMHAAARAESALWATHGFIEEAEFCFYAGLAGTATNAMAPPDERQARLDAIVRHCGQLAAWAALCPENMASRTALLAAEIARLEARVLDAETGYEQAIRLAHEGGQVHIEALANELASRFYAARGLEKIARVYMQDACYGYLRWGASGKVRQLEGRYPWLRMEARAFAPTHTMAAPVEHLDLATVIKVSQAASGEIVLEKLIDTVMRTAIQQAGAERGLLILCEGGEHRVAAEATTAGDSVRLRRPDVRSGPALVPESILLHVLRTREYTLLADAGTDPLFASDPYIAKHRARSILCLPLMNQAKLMGALYLENNLTAHVFSPARVAVLKLVASQAAISLENARLYRDVAERESKIRRLVDANIVGIIGWDADGRIHEANDVFLRMVGYERHDLESGAVRWRDLTPPDMLSLSEKGLHEALRTGRAEPYEKSYIRKDGSQVPVIVGLATFGATARQGVGFVLDLTERKRAEEQIRDNERRYRDVQTELAHANRVATMGQLAASIAHEVNQPIAATVTNAQAAIRWLRLDPPDTGEATLALSRIVKDANRAGDVLGRIRQLIRKAPPRKEPVDINAAIREVIELTAAEARRSGATVGTQLAGGLPQVEGDRVELQQVLLNLIINALEAMRGARDSTRELHIGTRRQDDGCVCVAVRDTGPGFGPDGADHMFTAFYTTKPSGLGMGLAICRSIIEAHGGALWADAHVPRGAILAFTLRAYPEGPAP